MGANSTQALGVSLFLAAFVFFAAGLATGVNAILIITAAALMAAACGVFFKVRPWEHRED